MALSIPGHQGWLFFFFSVWTYPGPLHPRVPILLFYKFYLYEHLLALCIPGYQGCYFIRFIFSCLNISWPSPSQGTQTVTLYILPVWTSPGFLHPRIPRLLFYKLYLYEHLLALCIPGYPDCCFTNFTCMNISWSSPSQGTSVQVALLSLCPAPRGLWAPWRGHWHPQPAGSVPWAGSAGERPTGSLMVSVGDNRAGEWAGDVGKWGSALWVG